MHITKHFGQFLILAVFLTGAGNSLRASEVLFNSLDSTWSNYTTGELFMEGNILMEEGFWHEASRVWSYAEKTHPHNRVVKFKKGVCMSRIGGHWDEVASQFEKVTGPSLTLRYDPFNPNQKLPPVEAWLWLAEAQHRLERFEAAQSAVDRYLAVVGDKHSSLDWASSILDNVRFATRALNNKTSSRVSPLPMNSEAQETHPVMTADGQLLFFSSNRARSNGSNHGRIDPDTREHYHDIYQVRRLASGDWGEPELLNVGLRNHAHVVGSDAFGDKLVVVDSDGWNHELKMTQRWERGWTSAEPLDIDKNIPTQGEVAFFPDKSRLIASVKSRKSIGGFDLFESQMEEDGRWSKLRPLGSNVNTWGDEITPFVAADGKTLFFASNGAEGMGGFDVYRTTRNNAGGWTQPEHLGAPINSVDDDLAFVLDAAGKVGFLATRRQATSSDLDLYKAELNGSDLLENEVVVLSLNASGLEASERPPALVIKDAQTGAIVQRVAPRSTEEVFQFIVNVGDEVVVESEVLEASNQTELLRREISVPRGGEISSVELDFKEVFVPESAVSSDEQKGQPELSILVIETSKTPTPGPVVEEPVVEEPVVEEPVVEEPVVEEPVVEEPVVEEPVVEVQPQRVKSQEDGSPISAPIAPLALSADVDGDMAIAIQLYSGQVHTERMDLSPVVAQALTAAGAGHPVLRIEGSASDGPSTRADGNMGLASSRAINVLLRLERALKKEGLERNKDYTLEVVRRVQPDGATPKDFVGGDAHPASFQYVRVDMRMK